MYRSLRVGVVVPAYNEGRLLSTTLRSMPALVDHIVVVDDASSDDTGAQITAWPDPRVHAVLHVENRGVGGAIVSGYRAAAQLGCDAIAVMAGDAQMDPQDLPRLLDALVDEQADYVKGDRSVYPGVLRTMPKVRLAGTTVLAYLTRLSSGLPGLRDTQCGYTVIRNTILERIPLDELYPRYGFPNDILNRIGEVGGRVAQVPVRPVYGEEVSGLRPLRVVLPISRILIGGGARRARNWARVRKRPGGGRWLALLATLAGLVAGTTVGASHAEESSTDHVEDARVQRFTEALEIVDEHYVDPVDVEALILHGTYGMVRTLDYHSRFMPARDYRVWRTKIHGRGSGVGVELLITARGVRLARVIPGSPAFRAGLRPDDRLLAVDDVEVETLSAAEIRARLRGAPGTEVRLDVMPSGASRAVTHRLVREKIEPVPVTWERLERDIAHVRVWAFQDRAAQTVVDAIETIEREGPVRGIVLDLRGNLGGLLTEAVGLADVFLSPGVVVVSLEGQGEVQAVHETREEMLVRHPVAVIVDHRSASASELVAGALQDHGRAALIGEKTYGKGSVQTTYDLPEGNGLRLTTSRYYTPNHHGIDEVGIVPDVVVSDPKGGAVVDAAVALLLGRTQSGAGVSTSLGGPPSASGQTPHGPNSLP